MVPPGSGHLSSPQWSWHMAGTALPMVMSSDTADPVDLLPAEVAQFAVAEEAVTRAEAASSAVDAAPA